MKTCFTLLFLSCTLLMSAQTDTDWAWFESVPRMSETSEMRDIATDVDGNVFVMGFIREPISPSEQGFAIAKYDTDGTKLWTYNIPGFFSDAEGDCDADGNVYIAMKYTETELVVESETLSTSDLALLKLDKDGNFVFVKAIGSDGLDVLYNVRFDGSEILVSALGLASFSRDNISFNIPLFGRPYMMAFDNSGNLTDAGIASMSYLDEVNLVTKENGAHVAYAPRETLKKYAIDAAVENPVAIAELDLVNQTGGFELRLMDVVSTTNHRIYTTGFFKSDYVLLEGDTIYALNSGFPTCFIIETDTALNVQNHIIYYDIWGLQNQNSIQKMAVYKDEKIAVKNWFVSVLRFPGDSLVAWNNQRSAAVTEFDLDLSVTNAAQTNTWDEGGWSSWDLEYDKSGNLYALYQHEEDLWYDSVKVASANKSWAHMCVLSKLGTGDVISGTSQNDLVSDLTIFPNPAHAQLRVRSTEAIQAIACFDLSGKQVKQWNGNSALLDVSAIPAGVYWLSVQTASGRYQKKFVKVN